MYSMNEISKISGLPASTLRYYEKEGILPNIKRNSSGRREYSEENIGLLKLIICLKDTGMLMENIKKYTDLIAGGEETLQERREILAEHKKKIEKNIVQSITFLEQLSIKIAIYDGLVIAK